MTYALQLLNDGTGNLAAYLATHVLADPYVVSGGGGGLSMAAD